ncbi:MAG: PqqD family peptide modification chaperone [Chloroflexi bacterium]|nr:PqqD family peptide modification chaperone [Chloroflexota bacterium]
MITDSPLHRVKGEKGVFVLNPSNGSWTVVNPIGNEILSLLEEGRGDEEISLQLSGKYNVPADEIRSDVGSFIKHLEDRGFFSPGVPGDGGFSGLYLEVTGRCNLSCRYCYNSPPVNEDMPEDIARSVILQAKEAGAKFLVIGGGEPLLYPGIWDMLEFGSSILSTALVTNGVLLDDESCIRLAEIPGLSIQLSLEGVKAGTHEAMRGKGSFNPAWRGLLNLLDRGMGDRVTLCFTMNKYNVAHFPEVLEAAKDLGIKSLLVQPLGKIGKAASCWEEISPGIDETVSALRFMDKHPVNVYGILPRSIREIFLSGKMRERCPIGEKLNVSFKGDVYPCSQLSLPGFKLGNVTSQTVSEMLGGEKLKSLQAMPGERIRNIPECSSCPWRMLCAGGCPASSLLESGGLNSPDPHCELIRMIFEETAREMANIGG